MDTTCLEEVDDTTPNDDTVYFFCPTKDPCGATSLAIAINKAEGAPFNQVVLCPTFFSGTTLESNETKYHATLKKEKLDDFPPPKNSGESGTNH